MKSRTRHVVHHKNIHRDELNRETQAILACIKSMQFKPSVLVIVVLATLAAATPTRLTTPASECTTGPVQCCDSVEQASGTSASKLLGLLDVVADDVNVLVGITCTPISVIGVGGNSCTAQPVCCEDNSFHGIVAIGCTPINLNL